MTSSWSPDICRVQLKARRQRSGESLQEFETNNDRLTRLAYLEGLEDYRLRLSVTFIDGIIKCLHGIIGYVKCIEWPRHRNGSDALVHALRFESASRRHTLIKLSLIHI